METGLLPLDHEPARPHGAAPPGERPAVDWAGVERDYRETDRPVAKIGRCYGVSHTAINKRAGNEGWSRASSSSPSAHVVSPAVSAPVSGGPETPPSCPAETAAALREAADRIEGASKESSHSDRWKWDEAREGGLVVAEEQRVTAVYTNPFGAVVIRQEASELDNSPDDDPFVFIRPEFVPKLIRALAAEVALEVELRNAPQRRPD
jgi:hypothetical protein